MRYALLPLLFLNVLSGAVPPAEPTVIPHIVDGGFWKTTLKFTNLEPTFVSFTVSFFKDDGTPMSVPIMANEDYVTGGSATVLTLGLDSEQTATIETAGTATDLTSGWALIQLTSAGKIDSFAIFRQHVPGGQDQEASVPAVTPSTNPGLSFDNTTYITGIALANPNPIPLPLDVYLRDRNGNSIGKQSLTLPASGHVAFSVPDTWASTAGITGTIGISTHGYNIAILGLRFNGRAFTTLNTFSSADWPIPQ